MGITHTRISIDGMLLNAQKEKNKKSNIDLSIDNLSIKIAHKPHEERNHENHEAMSVKIEIRRVKINKSK